MEPSPFVAHVVPTVAKTGAGAPLELLRGTEYCGGMSDSELDVIAELMRPVSYAPGDFVFKQGTPPDGLYILEEGEALFWTRIGDIRKDLVRFQPGQTLCGSALFETHGRIASCEATKPSRAWLLDLHAYQGLRARNHQAVFRMMALSAGHLGLNFGLSLQYFRQLLGMSAAGPSESLGALSPPQPLTETHDPLLKVVPFVKALDAHKLATLRATGRWREVKRGDRLASEGGPPGELHLVVRGALEASSTTSAGKVRFGLRGPGRWSGHESFFSGSAQPTDVVAKENAQLVSFEKPAFDALLSAREPLALDLLEQVIAGIAVQFDHDQRAMHKLMVERGHHASISTDEMLGRSPRPST